MSIYFWRCVKIELAENHIHRPISQNEGRCVAPLEHSKVKNYQQQLNMADSGNEESVWNILDKIIQASIHFKDTFRAGKSINNNRMTVKLCDYEL